MTWHEHIPVKFCEQFAVLYRKMDLMQQLAECEKRDIEELTQHKTSRLSREFIRFLQDGDLLPIYKEQIVITRQIQ